MAFNAFAVLCPVERLEREATLFQELRQLSIRVGQLKVKKCLLYTKKKDEEVQAAKEQCDRLLNDIKKLEQSVKPSADKIKALQEGIARMKKEAQRKVRMGDLLSCLFVLL